MPLSTGEKLGPYEILGLIGKGGMGEVYRARDSRLGRDVAVKISVERFTERFDREARVIASLNHPNISTLHDVGPNYLVMELVEGETLADRILQGALPLKEVLAIARQIVEALDAAHEKGITHRDLKPGNIKIKPDGTVKVLDFGLAKTGGIPPILSENSPTLIMSQTEVGIILGTAAYMSPEQAKGKPVDKRADIWAFGVVLYEMLTGQQLFNGETTTEVLAAVIEREPRWDRVPAQIQKLLRRCLEKDPKRRLRDIGDAIPLLEEQPLSAASARPLPWIGIAAVLLLALFGLSLVHFRESPPDVQQARLVIPVPEKFAFNAGTFATVSPNGRYIAFPSPGPDGVPRMWLRRLDSLEVKAIEGSEGVGAVNTLPFWSFDSRFIAYNAGTQLRKNDVSGGPAQIVSETTRGSGGPGGTWNRENVIIFGSNSGGLMRVAASSGKPVPVTILAPGETAHRWPQFLPDQHHFLYHRSSGKPESTGVYVGSIDVKPEEQSLTPLLLSDRQAEYVPSPTGKSGWLLFLREGSLMGQSFDPTTLTLSGDPALIAAAVGSYPTANFGFFSVSETGVLVYRGGGSDGSSQLSWVDVQGNVVGTIGDPGQFAYPAISPDEGRVAVSQTDAQGNQDIWIFNIAHGNSSRLTFHPGREVWPRWFPDGNRIVFASNRGGHFDLYTHAADGTGDDQLLFKSDEDKIPWGFSRDGRFLLFTSNNPNTLSDVWVLPMDGGSKPHALLNGPFQEGQAQFSPDGRYFAYTSNESGQIQVFVQPFSGANGTDAAAGKWAINKGFGGSPRWRGNQLLYMTPAPEMMAVDVHTEKTFQFENLRRLFLAPATANQFIGAGDISADGKRFLFVTPRGAANAPSPFYVILNWQASLEK